MDILDNVKAMDQRQDSVEDQLKDLIRVANRLGMYDAADVIQQLTETRLSEVRYGCHCDLEPGMEPDECVINEYGDITGHCIYAKPGARKEQCEYWRIIKNK